MKVQSAHIRRIRFVWQLKCLLQWLLISIGFLLLIRIFIPGVERQWLVGIVGIFSLFLPFNPLKITAEYVVKALNLRFPALQYSCALLLIEENTLSPLQRIQKQHVLHELDKEKKIISDGKPIWPSLGFLALSCAIFFMVLDNKLSLNGGSYPDVIPEKIQFSTGNANPYESKLLITPPSYTGLKEFSTIERKVNVPEGSRVKWKIDAANSPGQLFLIINMDTVLVDQPNLPVDRNITVNENLLISFMAATTDSITHRSPVTELRLIPDQPPSIQVQGINEFVSFEWTDQKQLDFHIDISDDYGIKQLFLIATVSSGEGESVRFRENRKELKQYSPTEKEASFGTRLNLDSLRLAPGDELYFYLECHDNRLPKANITRSETYFAQVRDTTNYEFSISGDLGIDILPEYFRSQRQIIIDTEKLIKDKDHMEEFSFNSTSNELGFDQKALRLRYGQFMGMEDESEIAPSSEPEEPEASSEAYTHDHDHEEEDAVVEADDANKKEDPLDEYLHDHGDPEAATFFKVSLKAKLKQAMAEMWDAELYLRLYEPEKSLPFQYRALELIKEIKNDSRIYVHRIGFEPPPIRNDKRLTGDQSAIDPSPRISSDNLKKDPHKLLRTTIFKINQILKGKSEISNTQLEEIRRDVISLAIDDPGEFGAPLALMEDIFQTNDERPALLTELCNELFRSLPDEIKPVTSRNQKSTSLSRLLQEEY